MVAECDGDGLWFMKISMAKKQTNERNKMQCAFESNASVFFVISLRQLLIFHYSMAMFFICWPNSRQPRARASLIFVCFFFCFVCLSIDNRMKTGRLEFWYFISDSRPNAAFAYFFRFLSQNYLQALLKVRSKKKVIFQSIQLNALIVHDCMGQHANWWHRMRARERERPTEHAKLLKHSQMQSNVHKTYSIIIRNAMGKTSFYIIRYRLSHNGRRCGLSKNSKSEREAKSGSRRERETQKQMLREKFFLIIEFGAYISVKCTVIQRIFISLNMHLSSFYWISYLRQCVLFRVTTTKPPVDIRWIN